MKLIFGTQLPETIMHFPNEYDYDTLRQLFEPLATAHLAIFITDILYKSFLNLEQHSHNIFQANIASLAIAKDCC